MASWVEMCEDEDPGFRELNEETEVREWSVEEELADFHGVPLVRRAWYDINYYSTGVLMTIVEETQEELDQYENEGLKNQEDGQQTEEEETDEEHDFQILCESDEDTDKRPLLEEEEGTESSGMEDLEEEEETVVRKKRRSFISRVLNVLRAALFPCVKR